MHLTDFEGPAGSGDRQTIPVILDIDVEPDDVTLDPEAPCEWAGFEAAHEWLSAIRPELEDRTGAPVRYSWTLRMDQQIAHVYGRTAWVSDRYAREWASSIGAGDEIGMHPHFHRWDGRAGRWRLDLTDQPWLDDCLLGGLDAFETAFGRRCRTTHVSMGFNETLAALLDRAGVQIDLSVEPGRCRTRIPEFGGVVTAYLHSHRDAPRHPYRPSRHDVALAGGADALDLTLIPLTMAPVELAASVRDIARGAKYLVKSRFRFVQPRVVLYLPHAWRHPNSFAEMLDRVLDQGARYLAFVSRSDFGRDRIANMRQALDVMLNHPRYRFVFTTPSESLIPNPLSSNPESRIPHRESCIANPNRGSDS